MYRIISKCGRDVLCVYKANPDDARPVAGFMGKDAAELADVAPITFRSFRAALRCAQIYGGEVQSPTIPAAASPVLQSVNGGW